MKITGVRTHIESGSTVSVAFIPGAAINLCRGQAAPK